MPVIARVLFLLFFFPAFIRVNIFVYRRLVRDVTDSRWVRRVAVVLMALALIAIPLMRFVFRTADVPRVFAIAAMGWWGFLMSALAVLLLMEPVLRLLKRRQAQSVAPEAVVDPQKRLFLARAAAGTATALSASVVGYGMRRAFEKPEVSEVSVKLPGLPKALDGFTIVQLTDIHVGSVIQEAFIDQLIETANGARPDLIAITGDLVDGTPANLGHFVARFRNLKSKYGTHFVSGNHDWYSGWDEWSQTLTEMNFKVLRNERVRIGDDAASFDLLGVDDWHSRLRSGGYDLELAAHNRDASRGAVLLAHQPQNFEAVSQLGIGLQLSGHTHGGQLFPGTLVGDLMWGAQNAGLSKVQNMFQYTSRGCGFVGPPMRIGAPPEVVKIVLVA